MRTAKQILTRTATIAVVGASRDPRKPAHSVPLQMQRFGWRIIPVNPTADELFGERVYRSLAEIPHPVDLVNVFRPAEDAVDVIRVPGAWELPLAAAKLARAGSHVAIVALGCVVRGDTRHYEQVADGCSDGLMRVQIDHGVPVANGVLAVDRFEDAQARAGGSHGNKGEEAALAALEMVNLLEHLR